jgi:hypothetical protein
MAAACAAAGMEFIPGTELTAEHDDTEVHLLGYFLDTENEKLLSDIARFQAVRQNRIREMVARSTNWACRCRWNPFLRWPIANRPGGRTWRARW